MMNRKIFLLLSFVGIFICGCQPNIVQRKNVICLIDYSGTIKPETLNIYAKTITDDVFGNLLQSDKMVLIPIDEGSKIKAVQLLYYDLNQQGFDKNVSSVSQRNQEIKQRLDDYKKENKDSTYNTVIEQKEKRKEFTNLTDILGAMEQVSSNMEHLETHSTLEQFWHSISGSSEMKSENVILIFSDMIHESSDLNFVHTKLDEKTIDKIITDLKSKNRIPDLTGTKVFVCGRTGKNNAMVDSIHAFWKKYFEESHADLKAYDFDSSKVISDYLRTQN